MSEGELHKRQRISEDEEVAFSEENNLKYQNACLTSRLKDQRKQISDLTIHNDQLVQKVRTLEDTLTNFNCSWAKVRYI